MATNQTVTSEEIRLTPEDKAIFRRLRRLTRGAVILHADDRCAISQDRDRRDAQITTKLAAGRKSFLKLREMDPIWAIGCRHSVLSNTDQLLPARRPTFDAPTTKFLEDSIARAARR